MHPGDKLRIHEKVISAGKDNLKEISNQWVQATYVWKRDLGTTKFFFGANFVSARFGNYKEFWELQMGITKIYQNKKYQF